MAPELTFPIEFIVAGTPASLGAKRPATRAAWRDRVKAASLAVIPSGHFATTRPLATTIFYFPPTPMRGDIDNIVKPILDALSRHIYVDDAQIERVWVQKFEPLTPFPFAGVSHVLRRAMDGEKPFVYIRVTDDLTEGLA